MPAETIAWEAAEYNFEKKSPDWFWALGIIGLAGGLAAILFGNYLFGIFIILAAAILGYYAARRPQVARYEISNEGARVGREFYPYRNLKAFWLEIGGPTPKLLLLSKGTLAPILTIPLGNASVPAVREKLVKNLPEQQLKEPVFHLIMEYLGF